MCHTGDLVRLDERFYSELSALLGTRRFPTYRPGKTLAQSVSKAIWWRAAEPKKIGDLYSFESIEPHDESAQVMVVEDRDGRIIAAAYLEYTCFVKRGAEPCGRRAHVERCKTDDSSCQFHGRVWLFIRDRSRHEDVVKAVSDWGSLAMQTAPGVGILDETSVIPVETK
jgi:hypothetical protein